MNLGKSTETQPKSTVTQAQSEITSEAAEQGGGQTAQAAEYPSELQASYSNSPSQELPLQATPVTAWQHNPVFHALSANKTLYTPVHGLATESIGTLLAAEEVVHVPEVTVADTSNSSQSSSPSSAGADKFKTPLAAPSPSAGVTPSGSPDRSVVTSEQGVPSFDAPLKYQSFREKFYNWQQRATTQAPFVPPVSGAGVLQQAVQGFAGLSFVPGATATLPAASSAAAFLASQPAPVASGQSALLQPLVTSSSQAAISRPAFEPVPLQYSAAPVRTSSVSGPSSAFPVQPPTAPLAQFLPATSVLSSSAIPSITPGLTTSGASAFGFDQVMFGMDSKADDRPKWSGERGVAWLNFQQYWQGKLATVRAQTLGRSVMCSLSLQQEMVLQGMKKDSVGEVDARDVWGCLQQQVYLAELGWFPPVLFPEEAITKVKRRQPAGIPVERILHNALQRCVQPMCQVAAAQSCALTTQVEIDHVLAVNVESPALQAVVLPSGQIRQATGFSRLKYLGRTCSPDHAVMEMFWILMHTMYAVSPQAENEFYALTQAGSQGTMDIRAFASEVERRYRCVEFVSGVVSEEVTSIIVAGLNSQEGRKYGEQRLEKDRQLSIDQLVEMLEERERTGQVKDLVAAKAARYGYVTGSSSSKSGKHLKADTDTGAQTSSTEMSKLVAKIRKQRGGYLRQLAKDNLPDAESIEKAIDYLITHPSHPKSLCISHWEKGNLHTKAECKSPDGTALAGMSVGGQQSGGQSGEGATGDRLFRAPPKPPAAPKGKKDYGVQPSAGTAAQHNTPCPVCQFPSGHPRGICFFAQPNMAADWWGGPNRRADPQVVVRYIEACAQQRVVPRLSRCGQTVDALLGSDSLSPQARAMLQQQFGQLGPPPSPNTTYMPQAQNRYAPRPMPTAYVPQHMATLQQAPMPMTASSSGYVQQPQAFMAASTQPDPNQASSSSSGYTGPRGYGWCQTVISETESVGLGAFAATRASTSRTSADTRRQPVPKSFVASDPVLPRDPNSSRTTEQQTDTLQEATALPLLLILPVTEAMMSETPIKPARSVAYSGKNHYGDVAANFPQELLFQPPNMSYVLQQQQRQGLDRFCCTSKRTGLTLVLSDDREILLDGAFHDSGANLLLLTQALCKEIGLTYRQGSGVPGVRGWKGFKEKVLLGYTDPFKLVFAKGTSYETTLHVPTGYVVPGDAQGMYTLCLDKQTVFAVFGHVNPLLQHFCWPHLPNLPPLLLPAPPAPQSTASSASEDSDDGEQSAEDLSASGILPLVHVTGPQPLVPVLSAMQVAGDPSAQWFRPGPEILQHLEPQGPSDVPHDAAWSIHPEGKWVVGNHPEASAADMQAMVDMLFSNKAAFAYDLDEVPGYQGPPIDFPLIDQQKNMFAKQRQYTTEEFEFGDDKLKEMLQSGIVVEIPTTNPYVSCITLPLKRAPDGSWTDKRFCIDLRDVNANITVDHFGMPLPEEIFRRIAGAKFLAKIDMRAGFWQIRLSEQAQQLTAFWWRGRMYAYTRMPFGYVNATAVFQRVMDTELAAAGIDNATVFVDDVLLWADTFEAHLQQLDLLFKHFVKVGLRAHPAKTVVAAQTIGYLGHLISATECQPEEAKVAAIKALEPPTSVKRLQAHLGLFNYYRAFVPGFSRIAQPLYKLTAKDVVWEWTEACLAAVLQQTTDDDTQYLVACASRSLNAAERNYPAWKGEMLAAVWGAWSPSQLQAAAAAWALLGGLQLGPSFQPAPSLPGLEMVLRNGFTVSRYLYSDTDLTAQTIALHRIMQLQEQYPLQLQQQALEGCFSAMPEDITDITVQHVHAAVLSQPSAQWLVVAGWPCQDFSLAGPSRGTAAARSRLLTDLVRLIGILQQLLPEQPPGYLLENVPMQYHRNSMIAQQDFDQVTRAIGQPVVLDAAQVGSFAHRLRNFWTNLCFPEQLQAAIQFVQRPPERELSSILAAHRQPMPVARMDRAPQYVCNMPGQARQAWPTIMSRPGSYAFRSGQPGSVIDCSDPARPQETEPTAVERELAMGYAAGTTAAFGVTEAERCRTLGQCMDANALQVLFALTEAIWQSTAQPCTTSHQGFVSLEPVKQNCQLLDALSVSHQSLSSLEAVCNAAAAQEQATTPVRGAGDVWEDPAVLQFLQTGELPRDSAPAAIRRIQRRSKHYSLVGDKLLRTMPDASQKVVPKPSERQQLVTQQHERAGHPGKRKPAALLLTRFWWYGLLADSEHLVGNCKHCSRIEADFTAKPQKLQPIPISSLAFRWHVDLAGPLPKSNRDHTFIMIAVEAFTKHLEVVPIHNKEAATVAYAFLHHVIAKFGAAGQVVTDSAADVLSPEISYADPESAAKDLRIRKETIKRICPVAMENLAIAQHRDQLRYLRSRDTNYQPKTKHFRVGDFVHVQQLQRNSTLQPRAQSVIYRIKE
eukprot:gene2868-biopygen4480